MTALHKNQMPMSVTGFPALLIVVAAILLSIHGDLFAQSSSQAAGETDVEEESGEEIMRREEYFYMRRAGGPGKRIPGGAYEAAVNQLRLLLLKEDKRSASALVPGWTNVTPNGMFYARTGSNYISGRVNSFAFHPTDPNTFYIAAAGGGIWKTTNGGLNFQNLTENLTAITSGAVGVDPNNGAVVYFATGELNYAINNYYGDGIFKSTDGGSTWSKVATTTYGEYFSTIIVHPQNSSLVYAGGSVGVVKSTNAGATWTNMNSGDRVNALVVDPGNPQLLYISREFPLNVNVVRKSTNGGSTWVTLGGGLPTSSAGRTSLAMAPSNSNILYASVASRNSPYGLLGLYRTTDAGTTWTLQNSSTNYLGTQGWFDNVVTVHPANPDFIVVGGLNIYSSTNGGSSLTMRTDWASTSASNYSHADIHFLGYNGTVLYCGSDGGAYKSGDDAVTWSDMNSTLSTLQCISGDYDPTNTQRIYLGSQDNNKGTTTDGGASWIQLTTGDGGYTVVDPVNPNYIYGAYVNGSIHRSANYGTTYFEIRPSGSSGGLFYNPYEMAPGENQTIVYGAANVWKTTIAQSAGSFFGWTEIASTSTVGGNASAIGISSQSSNTMYVGTSNGRVLVTTNNGSSWTVSLDGSVPFVSDLVVDPTNDAICYATFTGFVASQHVYKTTNRGATWASISVNLPNIPVHAIVLRATAPRMLIVGTDLGAYRSTNEGSSWAPMNNGMPAAEILDLKYRTSTNLLLAATHGRGIFTYNLGTLLTPRLLSVNSQTPDSGVAMTLSPIDSGGLGGGSTPLTRVYFDSMIVTVTAPATSGGKFFLKWVKDGIDVSANPSVNVLMDTNHVLTAEYNPLKTFLLTCASSNPSSGVNMTISPADNFGLSNGTSSFTRYYLASTLVTLSTPSQAGGNYFVKWQKDGIDFSTDLSTSLTMDTNHTMRAVYSPLPFFSVLPTTLEFGPLKGGLGSKTDSVTVTNAGNATLSISAVAASPSWYTVSPTVAAITSGASRRFYIRFSPPSGNAEYPGTVIFTHNASGSPDTVALGGRGFHIFSAGQPVVDFGDLYVGSTAHDSLSIGVDTTFSMEITSVLSTNSMFSVSPNSDTVNPGQIEYFDVSFHPASTGSQNGFLIFTHDQAGSPDTVRLSGRGVEALYSALPSSVSFGKVLLFSQKRDTIVVSNGGSAALEIASITGADGPFGVAPAATTVSPSGSTEISVTFTPESLGVFDSRIVLLHNAASSPDTILISGEGVQYLTMKTLLKSYWNLASIPYRPPSPLKWDLFPHSLSRAYMYFSNAYVPRDTLEPGIGYWIKYPAPETLEFIGASVLPETIAVHSGWNLVGAPEQSITTSAIQTLPTQLTTSDFFGYAGRYFPSDTLHPGSGYWVYASEPGSLIFPSVPIPPLSSGARRKIMAQSPPPPPDFVENDDGGRDLPRTFALEQNYPNPFNPSTVIRFSLPSDCQVTLRIYNISGQRIATLVEHYETAGYKSVHWDATAFPSGIYFYTLSAGSFNEVKKMVLIK